MSQGKTDGPSSPLFDDSELERERVVGCDETGGERVVESIDTYDGESSGTHLAGEPLAHGTPASLKPSEEQPASLSLAVPDDTPVVAEAPESTGPTEDVIPVGPVTGEELTRLVATMVEDRMKLWIRDDRTHQPRRDIRARDNSYRAANEETRYEREENTSRLSVRVDNTGPTCHGTDGGDTGSSAGEEIHTGRDLGRVVQKQKTKVRASNEETRIGRAKERPLPVRASHGGSRFLLEADGEEAETTEEDAGIGRARKRLGLLTRTSRRGLRARREIGGEDIMTSNDEADCIRRAKKKKNNKDPKTGRRTGRVDSGSSSDAVMYARRVKRYKSETRRTRRRKMRRDAVSTSSASSEASEDDEDRDIYAGRTKRGNGSPKRGG